MKKDILVSASEKTGAVSDGHTGSIRMAVVSDGELVDYAINEADNAGIVGNIYKGVVMNVIPGAQSCFVNIGHAKNAVLYAGDMLAADGGINKRPIETLVRPGQKLIVQALRDAAEDKGARVTTRLALPGKYVVLLPGAETCSVSGRITDPRETARLRDIARMCKFAECGVIIRTEAAGAAADIIMEEAAELKERLAEINRAGQDDKIPDCIYTESDFFTDVIYRALENDVARVITDDRESYRTLLVKAAARNPDITYKIQYYHEHWPLFAFHGVQSDVDSLRARRIWLKCGAYIVIDRTEAMTVVDVNTGKYTGTENRRDTFYRVNNEAVAEIARQIRLRNIGGIIVIDALKMSYPEDQRAIVGALENALKKDRQKTAVAGFTRLGLLEMTRKKAGAGLAPTSDEAPWTDAD